MANKVLVGFFIFLYLFLFIPQIAMAQTTDLEKIPERIACGHIGNACCTEETYGRVNVSLDFLGPAGIVLNKVGIDSLLEFAINNTAGRVAKALNDYVVVGVFQSERKKCFSGKAQEVGSTCNCVDDRVENLIRLCASIKDQKEVNECSTCMTGGKGIWTGAGCMQTNLTLFIRDTLLTFAIGLAGMIALLCIIYSAFMLQVSGGNPERIKKAREYLTSCIIGLILIIFSVFILQVIGVNILRIPGFN